jgi:hypothetical protein
MFALWLQSLGKPIMLLPIIGGGRNFYSLRAIDIVASAG